MDSVENKNNAGYITHNGKKYPKVYHEYPLWSDMKYRESRDGLPFSGPYSAFTPGKPLASRASAASHTAPSESLDDSKSAEEKIDKLSLDAQLYRALQEDSHEESKSQGCPPENIQKKKELEKDSFCRFDNTLFPAQPGAKRRSKALEDQSLVDGDNNCQKSKRLKQI